MGLLYNLAGEVTPGPILLVAMWDHKRTPSFGAPMLDVHPPHHPAHSWRDFFVHIATIVVGLLIAVGLEQTVEAMHRRHQRQELLESIHGDLQRIVFDTEHVDKMTVGNLHYLKACSDQVSASLKGQRLPPPAIPRPVTANTPAFPAWQAAGSAGEVSVLSAEDIKAFSEVAETLDHTDRELTKSSDDLLQVGTYIWTQGGIYSETIDVEKLTNAQKLEFLKLVVQAFQSVGKLQSMERQLHGAAAIIDQGERNLDRISVAERNLAITP